MELFVTGATGFIGHALVGRLLREGHSVRAYVRSPERARKQLANLGMPGRESRLSFVVALGGPLGGPNSHATPDVPSAERDLMRRAAIRAGISGTDAVIHLAGESVAGRWSEKKRERILAGRAGLGAQLVDAIAQVSERPKVFVAASAVGIYGDRGDEVLDERSALGDSFLARVCRQSEGEAERARRLGARVVRMRFGVVLGRDGGLLGRLLPLYRAGLGAVLGRGDQYLAWVERDDVVELLMRALTDARFDGPINVVAPEQVTQREFSKTLGHVLRRPTVLHAPGPLLRLGLGGMASLLLDSQRVEAGRLRELGYPWARPALEEALRAVIEARGGYDEASHREQEQSL